MQVLKRTRPTLREGDIFVYRMKHRPFGFGRVVRLDTRLGGFPDVILIYIYESFSETKDHIPHLSAKKLLLPPTGITRQAWTRGYFENVAYQPLRRNDVLRVHCFENDTFLPKRYVDEMGRPLSKRSEPTGFDAVDSYASIDIGISDALGIDMTTAGEKPPESGTKRARGSGRRSR
jgi:hypothetical protein